MSNALKHRSENTVPARSDAEPAAFREASQRRQAVPKAQPSPIAIIFVFALWCGLLTGFFEVGFHFVQRTLGSYWFLFRSEQFLWVTPLFDCGMFLIPGLLLIGLCVVFPKISWPRVALLAFSALFCWKVLVLLGGLHWLALYLLVLGLSIQTMRLLPSQRIKAAYPFVRSTAVLMILLAAALGVTQEFASRWKQQEALAQLPAARAGAPNVLIIVWDTVRAGNLSLYGHSRQTTPHLQRWAKKGVWFKHAMVPAPWTLPSHGSMFTGRYPHELSGTLTSPLDGACPTLAETLQNQGYLTAGFVANKWFTSQESGLARGFLHYEDYQLTIGEMSHCSELGRFVFDSDIFRRTFNQYDFYGRKNAAEVNQSFLHWLDGRQEDRPFFAYVNYFDAHGPYLPPPSPFERKFNRAMSDNERFLLCRWLHQDRSKYPKEVLQLGEDIYDSAICYMDHLLDNLLRQLRQRRVLDNTIVIVTSDHGEHFGEHRLFDHGHSLYRPLIHVPLVIVYPKRVPANTAIAEFVTLRDLPATVQDLTDTRGAVRLPGNSWRQYWDRSIPTSARQHSPVFQVAFHRQPGALRPNFGCSPTARGSLVSLFHMGKYYILNLKTGQERIYDFISDPLESTNLAASKEHRKLLEDFRARLNRVLEKYKSRWTDFP